MLSTQSVVSSGDTLVTVDKTYARVRFSDASEGTLRPSTQLQIENWSFDRTTPEKDDSAFRLFKEALRDRADRAARQRGRLSAEYRDGHQ